MHLGILIFQELELLDGRVFQPRSLLQVGLGSEQVFKKKMMVLFCGLQVFYYQS